MSFVFKMIYQILLKQNILYKIILLSHIELYYSYFGLKFKFKRIYKILRTGLNNPLCNI